MNIASFVVGFGALMTTYTIIKLVAGIAPKKYVDRHILKLKRIVTLDLSLEEKVQVLSAFWSPEAADSFSLQTTA